MVFFDVFGNKARPIELRHGKWQIISKVFASVPLSELSYEERLDDLPFAVGEPVRGVLEYYRGGHLSRPDACCGMGLENTGKLVGGKLKHRGDHGIYKVTEPWVSGALILRGMGFHDFFVTQDAS